MLFPPPTMREPTMLASRIITAVNMRRVLPGRQITATRVHRVVRMARANAMVPYCSPWYAHGRRWR